VTCAKKTAVNYECAWSKLAFDGTSHTITLSVYSKNTAPVAADFTVAKPFDDTTGFAKGDAWTFKWSQSGAATAAGTNAAAGTVNNYNANYRWAASGNILMADKKTFMSKI